jgi:hypothetical protein
MRSHSSCSAASRDGHSARCGLGPRGNLLDRGNAERCLLSSILGDSELLELGHCFFAGGVCVDGEDHALSAVGAGTLLAVEPSVC